MSQNDEQAFFVDDELVERLMRGDSPTAKPKTQRAAETSALGNAIKLAAAGRLDDAIKEHLELKRKHGVPEDELQRQEEEALGPARREVAQQHEDGEPEAAEAAAEDEALADADEGAAPAGEVTAASTDQETVLFDMEEPGDAHAAEDAPEAGEAFDRDQGLGPDEEEPEPDEGELEPDEGELEPDEEELLSPEEETAAEDGDADVLEDTPDFLQETPEHDRLWFEQKPPRDFDFD